MNTDTGITVVFEDHGQDFLEFDIKGGKVIAARPFQNDIWCGWQVANKEINDGDYIDLREDLGDLRGGYWVRSIRYPVIEVRPLVDAVQIGPTDI